MCDEARNVERDFTCAKVPLIFNSGNDIVMCGQDILLREMAYFRSYLAGGVNADDIDIRLNSSMAVLVLVLTFLSEQRAL